MEKKRIGRKKGVQTSALMVIDKKPKTLLAFLIEKGEIKEKNFIIKWPFLHFSSSF
jgi:hypothetical protein